MYKKFQKESILILVGLLIITVASVGFCASKTTVKVSKKTIEVGQSATVTFNPKGIKKSQVKNCTWSSSDKKVVKIITKSTKGKKKVTVKGVKKGSAYIKVKCNKNTYKIKVTVKTKKATTQKIDNTKPDKPTEPTEPTEPTTTEDIVDPATLIGKLNVDSAWYYDSEGKEKVKGTLAIDKDNTSFTLYRITTYTINGKPVSLSTLKQANRHNAISLYTTEEAEQYVTTLCDGTERKSKESDNWKTYKFMPEYSADGKIVYQYKVFNDFDKDGISTLNFQAYAVTTMNSLLDYVGQVGSFKIVPECRNTTITGIDTITDKENVVGSLETVLKETYKKVTTTKNVENLSYTITHYQLCENAGSVITYCTNGDYIYTDTSKYNLGIYYRFNDMCDNCKNNLACSDETINKVLDMKRTILKNVYFPKSYENWNDSTIRKLYYDGKICTGYTVIETTGQDKKSRMVYKAPLSEIYYNEGKTMDINYSSTLQ